MQSYLGHARPHFSLTITASLIGFFTHHFRVTAASKVEAAKAVGCAFSAIKSLRKRLCTNIWVAVHNHCSDGIKVHIHERSFQFRLIRLDENSCPRPRWASVAEQQLVEGLAIPLPTSQQHILRSHYPYFVKVGAKVVAHIDSQIVPQGDQEDQSHEVLFPCGLAVL